MRRAWLARNRMLLLLTSFLVALIALAAACAPFEADTDTLITASGFIEGEQATVAAEIQGLIVEILADHGDYVSAGEVVIRIDDTALTSQQAEALAALSAANANLRRVQAGPRAEEIAAARAARDEAQARRDGAQQAVVNAQDVISNPRDLDSRIDEARAQVKLAQENVELHKADLEATRVKRGAYAEQGGDVARIWDHQLNAAEARLSEAEAQVGGARAYLTALIGIRDNPLTLEAELHQAQMQLELAYAEASRAQARLDEYEAGPTPEELALANAEVRQAQAGVGLIDARLDQLILTAPMSGIVATRSSQVGETATAGRPLLTIANLDEVTLVIYIPVDQIGHIAIGQAVEVTVDSFPDRVFSGRVVTIAGEAEFTPSYVQTKEERIDLVFAVDVLIPNPDHALKPGMPADASLRAAHPSANGN